MPNALLTLRPRRSVRLACLCLVLIFSLSTNVYASRVGYGATHYPIWSELTYFERSTLSEIHLAKKNDPDALLALYLVASGVRDSADYETVRRRIDEFLAHAQKLIIEKDDPRTVGQLLNREMHNFFFLQESRGGAPNGYAMDQSRLMGIFETGEFNCISASLLYAVLGRHFNLGIKGVLLPSHAFVELDTRNRLIDVETTSPHGFDQKHDEAFYKRNNNDWFASRGLQPATYADYLERKRVSPTLLGARNMLNQHTSKDQMDLDDSARLAEISAFIEPGNLMAQEKRLYFYNREIQALVIDQEWETLVRLFNKTYQTVMTDSRHHLDQSSLQNALQMYLSGAMLAYAHQSDIEQTLAVLGEVLARELRTSDDNGKQVEMRVTNAISVLLTKLVERQRFDDGLLVLALTEGHLSNPQAWPDMTNWFYLRWAEHLWEQNQWQEVVEVLSEYTMQAHYKAKENNQPHELISSAYYNWVLALSQNNELTAAQDVVEQCQARPAHQGNCQRASAVLKQALSRKKAEDSKESL